MIKHIEDTYEHDATDSSTPLYPEPPNNKNPKRRKRVKDAIFLLPSAITSLSFFFGFLAIRFAMDGRLIASSDPVLSQQKFSWAAYALLAAGVCDGLDGSVARFTRTQSKFGEQLDSLSDLAVFGIAPSIIIYLYSLHSYGKIGFAAAFIYSLCGALRLARFNVEASSGNTGGNFTGIPIPLAAAPLAVFILTQTELMELLPMVAGTWGEGVVRFFLEPQTRNLSLLFLAFVVAFGMISNFEYVSTKSIRLPRKRPFMALSMGLLIGLFFLIWQFTLTLAVLLVVYVLHGPLVWVLFKRDRSKHEQELFEPGLEEEDI